MSKFEGLCIGGPYKGQMLGAEHETVQLVIYPPMNLDELKKSDAAKHEPQPAGEYRWTSVFVWHAASPDLLSPVAVTAPVEDQN